MCSEADAATGMVATNSVAPKTGNISAGTSIFSMIVLDKSLKIFIRSGYCHNTDGYEVAMIHANNCTSDINAWVDLFGEVLEVMGVKYEKVNFYKIIRKRFKW